MRRSYLLLTLFLLTSFLLSACGGRSEEATAGPDMASMQGMPAEVQEAPLTVQQAYQYAVANPDVTQHIPCYCGCGAHTFYQRDVLVRPDGQVEVIESTPLYDMEACID